MSTSAVSRQVAELEAHLGARLLNRTTRRLSLTEAGQAFYERSVQLLADLEEAEASVRREHAVPRGTLRLTCGGHLRRALPGAGDRRVRRAAIRSCVFDLDLSDRVVDLVDEGFDLAIRIGPPRLAGLVVAAHRLDAARLLRVARVHGATRRTVRDARGTRRSTSASSYTNVAHAEHLAVHGRTAAATR